MGISRHVVKSLRLKGHDALHLLDLRLSRAEDTEIIEFVQRDNRIILTHDLDFGTLMAASKQQLPSIVIFRLTDMQPDNVNQYLEAILSQHSDVLLTGAALSISDYRIRVRRLPIH